VPAGEFLLRARPEWRTASGEFLLPATATVEVLPERETRAVLRSRRGGRIDLEVLDPERSLSPCERTVRVDANAAGAPERLELRFLMPAPSCGGTFREIEREGGYRSDTVLEPGTYVFSVRGEEFEEARAVAVVRPGEVTPVRVEVHRR